jgi:hypothetical protein
MAATTIKKEANVPKKIADKIAQMFPEDMHADIKILRSQGMTEYYVNLHHSGKLYRINFDSDGKIRNVSAEETLNTGDDLS